METALQKHTIWSFVPVAETFEDFRANVLEELFLNTDIPEDIKHDVQVAEKIILHSYFEYEFIDIALTQVTITLEKAMKLKYKEINNEETRRSLKWLIDWFFANSYFETNNETFLHALRRARNRKMHNTERSLGGMVFIKTFYDTVGLINDLYEDNTLRIQRKAKLLELKNVLNEFLKEGGILYHNNQKLIIFNAYPVFINNKKQPEELYLSVCPIFDLAPYRQGETFTPCHLRIVVKKWHLDETAFTAEVAGSDDILRITKIVDDANWERFCNWNDELLEIDKRGMVLFMITEPLNEYNRECLSEFYKTG